MTRLKEIVEDVETRLHCNCDLDNWQPQTDTGHSRVCRIDNAARERYRSEN